MQLIKVFLKGKAEPEVFTTNVFGGAHAEGMFLKVVVCVDEGTPNGPRNVWQQTFFYPHDTVERVEVEALSM